MVGCRLHTGCFTDSCVYVRVNDGQDKARSHLSNLTLWASKGRTRIWRMATLRNPGSCLILNRTVGPCRAMESTQTGSILQGIGPRPSTSPFIWAHRKLLYAIRSSTHPSQHCHLATSLQGLIGLCSFTTSSTWGLATTEPGIGV